MTTPLLPDVGVIGLVPDVWGDVWMPRHQVLTRLARYFHVAWMDPPRGWREFWLPRGTPSPRPDPQMPSVPGFHLYRPGRWLPLVYRPPALAALLDRLRIARARRLLEARGVRRFVLYLWRPEFAWTLDAMPGAVSCYHVDDEYSFSTVEVPVDPGEAALLRRADQVFIHSPALWEKKAGLSPKAAFVPNGVDFAAYSTGAPEPEDMKSIPRPRVGYVGVVKRFLDMPLLCALARRHPEWSFVIIGPVRPLEQDAGPFEALSSLANVHLLGPRLPADLPAYTQHLDVGMMPYAVDDYTKYIYPLKLHEYLAAGLPVVATPIRTLLDFGRVVRLSAGLEQWSESLRAALAPEERDPSAVSGRRGVARSYDWNAIAHRIATYLAGLLGPRWVDGVRAAAPDGVTHGLELPGLPSTAEATPGSGYPPGPAGQERAT